MGASKSDIYSKEINDIAALAKVFSHPARVAILQYISKQDGCICSDIVDEIGLSQPTISQHLQVINNASLLKGTFKGKSICYCLNMQRIKEFQEMFNQFLNNTTSKCC
ncbi:MAG TPA: metalloregulator ArsR/SmtB family transcription factor [Aquaticitalea sp.]|nr:metalloregulator ArsR/SmtB family transcription factor [Aquaticitalea sp.]